MLNKIDMEMNRISSFSTKILKVNFGQNVDIIIMFWKNSSAFTFGINKS